MPTRQARQRAEQDKREGKSPSTQAGEFIREEIHHIREGMHGARSARQAIAIGLSKARRAGVELKPPAPGRTSPETRRQARAAAARRGATERSASGKRAARTKGAAGRSAAAKQGARTRAEHARG